MENKVMIITGASSGIGAAVARRMARGSLRITLAARREDRLRSLASEVKELGGEALVVLADVNRPADIENMVRTTLDQWGRVDILFNNAGIARDTALVKMALEDMRAEVQTNLLAVIETAHAVLPVMLRQRAGHIINTSSMSGLIAGPFRSVYCATKFGVVGFSDALRRELLGTGVHVSAFCPGNFPSEIAPAYKAHADGDPDAPRLPGLMPVAYVADQVAGLIRRPRRTLVIPRSWRLLVLGNFLFPAIADRLVRFF